MKRFALVASILINIDLIILNIISTQSGRAIKILTFCSLMMAHLLYHPNLKDHLQCDVDRGVGLFLLCDFFLR